ncbi:uncharacterized protein LOC125495191 [Beta vulgaris subsp. vulgaris]|uniref:uncharacterized protein LOC125495191 n=1 Tax=Beta vulgaris subsp. vulgaris TaxID=3555 RepID=UPI002547DC2D|nr:uncharacterized protein LOC125495191 [Beta vulgaris subsp. vulgaris]
MEMGLRFPLTPFVKDLLNAYNLTISQIFPNSWGGIIAVQTLCAMLSVRPTITLWRHMFKLVEMMAGENGPGWWYFQARQGYKAVLDLPTSQKGFRREFAFVFYGGDWGVPTVRPEVEPNHELNFRVPELSEEEAVATIYMQTEAQIVQGGAVYVASNWLPSCRLLKNEHLLSAVGLSRTFPKASSLAYLLESDPDMADKLNYAAMRAAQLKAEMKAKKISTPPQPKDPSKPKASKKRKERAPEKVAMTKKALAKAQVERTKKAKSVEVNSPRPEERADRSEGTRISLHSDDFRPIRSPQYTSSSPPHGPNDDPEELSLALTKSFAELDIRGLDTRWTNAVDCPYSPADKEHIAATSGPQETDDLFHCWVEVATLEAKGKKHFDELHAAKEGQRIAGANLANAERCIKRDQEDFQTERDGCALEKAALIKAKEEAELAKLAADEQAAAALNKVAELNAALAELEKQPKTGDEWFAAWKETKACETFVNQVGSIAQKMGHDDALKRLKEALAKSHPCFSWSEAMASYKTLQDAEDQAIIAELNIYLSEGSEEAAEVEEAAEEAVEEDQGQGVARSEELNESTNEQTDPPVA